MTATAVEPAVRPAPQAAPLPDAIVVDGLRKSYDERTVVDGLSFSVRSGELFALLGPNGAGKTTTVEIVEGYRRADAGTVRVLGLDPARQGSELRARLGLMLQSGGVYPQARPPEILRLFAQFYRDPLDPETLLRSVGLEDAARTRYKVLSGGQKQRLGLALALIGRPELVILDEPTAGMDPHAKAATRQLIADLRASGMTIVLTTHELADVERLADRIAVIDRGRLVALGTMAELAAGAAPRLRFRLARALSSEDARALGRVLTPRGGTAGAAGAAGAGAHAASLVQDGAPGRYRLDGVAPDPAAVSRLTAWCADRGLLVEELRTTGGTLEERFLELTAVGAERLESTPPAEAAESVAGARGAA